MARTSPVAWDLLLAAALVLLLDALVLAGVEGALRVAVAVPTLLVVPGYVLSRVLFPEAHRRVRVSEGEEGVATRTEEEGMAPYARAAVSVALSVALVPLVGLALGYTYGVRPVPYALGITAVTLPATLAAWWRRARLPPERRPALRPPAGLLPRRVTRTDAALAGLLAVSALVAVLALVHAVTAPKPDDLFTEFYVLSEEGLPESLVGNLTPGEPFRLVVGIANHEGRPVAYRVEAHLVEGRVEEGPDGERTFVPGARTRIDAWDARLDAGEVREETREFYAPATPGDHRLVLELRRETDAEPYRALHVPLRVVTG